MAGKHKINIVSRTIGLSLFHGLILSCLCLFFIQQPFLFPDEDFLIKTSGIFKNIVLGVEEKPDHKEYLFVNTSYDNALIDKLDENTGFPLGNQVITNRGTISSFISQLKRLDNPHKYLFCDIFFESESADDALLQEAFTGLEDYLVPYHYSGNKFLNPVIQANFGLGDYETVGDGFFKFKLIRHDTLKTIPLLMFENLYNKKVKKEWYGTSIDGKMMLNNFIVNLRVRDYDLKSGNYSLVNLGELLLLDSAYILEMTKDKLIFIGNFYNHDQHKTLFGSMSGTLLIANVFHALQLGDPLLSWWFLIFLFAAFSAVSFMVVWHGDPIEKISDKIFGRKNGNKKVLKEFPFYLMLLALISFLSFFLFSLHLQIFMLNLYIVFINWLHK